jgi:hypothetical protein
MAKPTKETGHKTSGSEVSKYKTKLKQGAEASGPVTEAAPPSGGLSALVARLKEAADAVGGAEEAKKILDLLAD